MDNTIRRQSVMIRGDAVATATASPHKRKDPVTAAVATKLIRDQRQTGGRKNYDRMSEPDYQYIETLSQQIGANITDIENIFEVLPEIERCEMIITSCILSPDDMKTTNWQFGAETTDVPNIINSALVQLMEDYLTKDYKIKDLAPKVLKHGLFKSGCYPILFVPESTLDTMINDDNVVSTEAYQLTALDSFKPIGIIGDNNKTLAASNRIRKPVTTLESLFDMAPSLMSSSQITKTLSVTDNPGILRLPAATAKMTRARMASAYLGNRRGVGISQEARGGNLPGAIPVSQQPLTDLARRLYVNRRFKRERVLRMRPGSETGRNTIGQGLVMPGPPDAFIPVFSPSDPSDHIAYWVPLDKSGNMLSSASESKYHQELNQRLSQNTSETSQVLANVKTAVGGTDQYGEAESNVMSWITMVETDLLQRMHNGALNGQEVKLSRPMDVYRLMWSRYLSNKETQMLFVPAEMVSYFAFDYHRNGVGRSLTDRSKILASIRAILLFASTHAAVRAAVGHKNLNLQLDPDTPDPDKVIQMAVHEYIRVNNGKYPLGSSDPNDIFSYLAQAGITVNVEGHPGYPDVKASIESTSSAIQPIDQELERELRNRHISTYGLAPETVDASTGVDFAATIRTSNVFMDKQMTQYKDSLCSQLSDHARKLVVNNGSLQSAMYDIVNGMKDQVSSNYDTTRSEWVTDIIEAFLDAFRIDLPDSANTKLETQLQKLTTYSQLLDVVFNYFATPDILARMRPDMDTTAAEVTITIMKGQFLRNYCIANGIMPEITDVLTWPGDEDSPAFDFMKANTSYMEALSSSLDSLITSVKEMREKQQQQAGENNDATATPPQGDAQPGADSGTSTATTDDFSGGDTATTTTSPTESQTPDGTNTEQPDEQKGEGEGKEEDEWSF